MKNIIINEKKLYKNGWININYFSKLNYAVYIIISERGMKGKTFNAKQFIISQYRKNGAISGWVLNNVDMWTQKVWINFISKNEKLYPDLWKNVKVEPTGLYDEINGNIICLFLSLPRASKYKSTGRNTPLNYLFYDEFNEGLKTIRKNYLFLFESINNTFAEILVDKKGEKLKNNDGSYQIKHPLIFCFGNNKSIIHPLFEKYGIISLKKKINIYHQNNKKILFIYVPEKDIKNTKIETRLTAYQLFSKKIGMFDYSFKNLNTLENLTNVKGWKWFLKYKNIYKLMNYVIILNNNYYEIYINNNIDFYYIKKIELKNLNNRPLITSKKSHLEIGATINSNLKDFILDIFRKKIVFFDTQTTKIEIIKNI